MNYKQRRKKKLIIIQLIIFISLICAGIKLWKKRDGLEALGLFFLISMFLLIVVFTPLNMKISSVIGMICTCIFYKKSRTSILANIGVFMGIFFISLIIMNKFFTVPHLGNINSNSIVDVPNIASQKYDITQRATNKIASNTVEGIVPYIEHINGNIFSIYVVIISTILGYLISRFQDARKRQRKLKFYINQYKHSVKKKFKHIYESLDITTVDKISKKNIEINFKGYNDFENDLWESKIYFYVCEKDSFTKLHLVFFVINPINWILVYKMTEYIKLREQYVKTKERYIESLKLIDSPYSYLDEFIVNSSKSNLKELEDITFKLCDQILKVYAYVL